ncbi:MAG: hypothetical protein QME61_00950 [Patescibacteria group bacterium]|nr:hypothetical protein [Patescibacteria group bacterium]
MLFILLSLILFFGILFIFGWQLSRFVLNEKRIEVLVPLATITGIGVYLFLLNSFSYFIKIQFNFYLILVILAGISLFLFFFRKKEKPRWEIDRKWRKILFGTAFLVMALTGIIALRHVDIDEQSLTHLPLAASISEGNFPVKELFAPRISSQSHYGVGLFQAAITKITHFPIWYSQSLLYPLFLGISFLLGFSLLREFFQENLKIYLTSLLTIYGGGFRFIYGIEGISTLYKKFVLLKPIEAPFKFVGEMISGKANLVMGSFIKNAHHSWAAISFSLLLAVIYFYFRAVKDEKNWLKITLLNSVFFSFLALTGEIFFVGLALVLISFPLAFLAIKKNWKKTKSFLKISALLLLIAVPIASFQGGVFTHFVKGQFSDHKGPAEHQFSISPEYLLRGEIFFEPGEGAPIKIFSPTFLIYWGWALILLIPATIYFLRKSFSFGLFLITASLVFFVIPIFVRVGSWQGDFLRLWYATALFWNILVGFFLVSLLLFFKKRWQTFLLVILILSFISEGLLFHLLYPIFPNLEKGRPFLAELKKPTEIESEALHWIKKNTTIKDHFLTFEEEMNAIRANYRFIIFTGRFAPTFLDKIEPRNRAYFPNIETTIPERRWYKLVIAECDPVALGVLNYRYLYVNEDWPQGLEEKCLSQPNLSLNLKFSKTLGDETARIYLIE